MDSGNESEPSSIKLRKYAKKPRIGLLRMQDGTIHDVPGWSEEPDRINKVLDEIVQIERAFGKRASFLRSVFILYLKLILLLALNKSLLCLWQFKKLV